MTQNLRLSGTSISATTSNVTSNRTLTYYQLDTDGATSEGQCYEANGYNNACIKDSGSTNVGVWYKYYAASADTISGSSNSTTTSEDICPKNWKLPTAPNSTLNTDLNILMGSTSIST